MAIACERFKRKKGRFPENVSKLAPTYIVEIPKDQVTGDLIRYKLDEERPCIDSVGVGRRDDHAEPLTNSQGERQEFDFLQSAQEVRGDWILWPKQ